MVCWAGSAGSAAGDSVDVYIVDVDAGSSWGDLERS